MYDPSLLRHSNREHSYSESGPGHVLQMGAVLASSSFPLGWPREEYTLANPTSLILHANEQMLVCTRKDPGNSAGLREHVARLLLASHIADKKSKPPSPHLPSLTTIHSSGRAHHTPHLASRKYMFWFTNFL